MAHLIRDTKFSVLLIICLMNTFLVGIGMFLSEMSKLNFSMFWDGVTKMEMLCVGRWPGLALTRR